MNPSNSIQSSSTENLSSLSALASHPTVEFINDGFALCEEDSLNIVFCNPTFRKWLDVHDLSVPLNHVLETLKTDILFKRLKKRGVYSFSIEPEEERKGFPVLMEVSIKPVKWAEESCISVHVHNTSKLKEKDALIASHSRMIEQNNRQLARLTKRLEVENIQLYDKAEEAIKESERRLRMIIEATPVAIVVSHLEDGSIAFTNAIAGPLVGLSSEDLIGRRVTDFYADPSKRARIVELLKKDNKVDHYEVEIVRKDDSRFWADISMRFLEFNEKHSVLAAWNDISHLKELNKAARRFVPHEYLSFLEKDSLVDIHLVDHVTDEMTVMFSDLRSFTTISEEMTPQQNFDFINAYLGRVSPMARENGGFIVKYLGDGIMAIFPGNADDGVQAGIDKLNQVNLYNVDRAKVGRLPVGVGIGVNTGHMMVGMVGEAGRMQGDAFSDDVNLTSRIEGLTKHYSVSFIITVAHQRALGRPLKIQYSVSRQSAG